jgi:hypothetical protein
MVETRTWTTVSLAEHSHLSSPLKPFALAHVANHECPVLSCARRYARFLGSVSQSRCARFDVSQSSILHNTGKFVMHFSRGDPMARGMFRLM